MAIVERLDKPIMDKEFEYETQGIEDPSIEIARLPLPLFKPRQNWELNGLVNNVVFPTGTALFGDTLYIYYGAANEQIACASLSFSALLNELLDSTIRSEK